MPGRRHVTPSLLFVALVCGWRAVAGNEHGDDTAAVATQPTQPAQGPGSSDYPHADVQVTKYGKGARQYWLFTPNEPVPAQAPVIVFLHGWSAMEPDAYSAWIRHLVRRGNIVIYPRYQEGFGALPSSFVERAVNSIHDAVSRLQSDGTVVPQLDKLGFVGHSMGAIMSANIAQNAERHNLPAPLCLFLAEPTFEPILGRYDQIPRDTLMVIVVGSEVKRDRTAQRILAGSTRIAPFNKNYVALASDLHGNPPLISDHFAPCAMDTRKQSPGESARSEWHGRTRDTLDYYGYWKICDGLFDAAFRGMNREYAFGNTAEVRFMGHWSDGRAVEPATVLSLPDSEEPTIR